MLGYTMKKKSSTPAPWKMRLEAKIKTTRKEVSQLGEIQKSVEFKDKTRLLGRYKGLSTPEVLETTKQRLATLASTLRRYTKEAETKKLNAPFSKEVSKVYSQLQYKNTVRPEPPKAETERYWKTIWEDEKTQHRCTVVTRLHPTTVQ